MPTAYAGVGCYVGLHRRSAPEALARQCPGGHHFPRSGACVSLGAVASS